MNRRTLPGLAPRARVGAGGGAGGWRARIWSGTRPRNMSRHRARPAGSQVARFSDQEANSAVVWPRPVMLLAALAAARALGRDPRSAKPLAARALIGCESHAGLCLSTCRTP